MLQFPSTHDNKVKEIKDIKCQVSYKRNQGKESRRIRKSYGERMKKLINSEKYYRLATICDKTFKFSKLLAECHFCCINLFIQCHLCCLRVCARVCVRTVVPSPHLTELSLRSTADYTAISIARERVDDSFNSS